MSGLTPSVCRDGVRTIVGLDNSDLIDNDCDVYLNRALWWLQNFLKLPENEVIEVVQTVAGQVSYSLAYPVEGLLAISLYDSDLEKLVPLNPIGGYARDDAYYFDTLAQGKPQNFERFGRSFYLQPIPDEVYDLHCRRRDLFSDISSLTTTIALDPTLHEVLIYAAAERVFLDLRDFNSSDRMKREWANKLQGYKTQLETEQDNWKYAQVKVMRPSYDL